MKSFKTFIKDLPLIGPFIRNFATRYSNKSFPGSAAYWEQRYRSGGNSGAGSYHRLAQFKADVLNRFIEEKNIASAVEFGCGDGNNLSMINYPEYTGLDVSATAIKICSDKFAGDATKKFFVYNADEISVEAFPHKAEISLSLDVIYHLVEDEVFEKYMQHLFAAAEKFVIIYARDYNEKQSYHERSRNFTQWISVNIEGFKLVNQIENPYPFDPANPDHTSDAGFYFYEKTI